MKKLEIPQQVFSAGEAAFVNRLVAKNNFSAVEFKNPVRAAIQTGIEEYLRYYGYPWVEICNLKSEELGFYCSKVRGHSDFHSYGHVSWN